MSRPLGSLCIVLHGHLPYVLHHGSYPHGEAWLYEAAAETYLPILDIIGECALLNARPAITIGLTPVLLEQLAHERFKVGFVDYLKERRDRAIEDRNGFEKKTACILHIWPRAGRIGTKNGWNGLRLLGAISPQSLATAAAKVTFKF
jgi:predicted glycosyl hydrolase (DUF1957 family)